jgi:tRNA threonylcarbamoyl adenosine modification protein YjeE
MTIQTFNVSNVAGLREPADYLLDSFPNGAVVALSGPLGAGKTTWVKAVIEGICEKQKLEIPRVISPTFVLHQAYHQLNPPVDHLDLYRLGDIRTETLMEIGFWETLERRNSHNGFIFVEWAEKIPRELEFCFNLRVNIRILDENSRQFSFETLT